VVETPEPIVVETPEPIVVETPEPIVVETPEPIVVETPEPIVVDATVETSLLTRETSRYNRLKTFLASESQAQYSIGMYLFLQRNDFNRNLSRKESEKRFRLFVRGLGYGDMRLATSRIEKYLILRRFQPDARKIGFSLNLSILQFTEKMSACSKGNLIASLKMSMERIESADESVIRRKLNEIAQKEIVRRETPTTDKTNGTTDKTNGTTDKTNGTTDKTNGTTDKTNGTTDTGKFVPLTLDGLDSLLSNDERADILSQYLRSLEGTLDGLRGLDQDEITQYIGNDGQYIIACLKGIEKEAKALASRIQILMNAKNKITA
jgi:hypothetical protein